MENNFMKLASIFFIAVLTACSPQNDVVESKPYIKEFNFGDEWPLTVNDGVLICDDGILTFENNGVVYAANGWASSAAKWPQNKYKNWQPIDSIWKDNKDFPGTKINIKPFLEKGLSLCQSATKKGVLNVRK